MVVIRLSRGGSKKRPFYRFVVADKRARRDGRYIERIGFYKPDAAEGEESLRIAMDRLEYWKGVGAQVSPTVTRLIKEAKAGKTVGEAKPVPAAKPAPAPAAEEAPAEEAAAEESAETPAEAEDGESAGE